MLAPSSAVLQQANLRFCGHDGSFRNVVLKNCSLSEVRSNEWYSHDKKLFIVVVCYDFVYFVVYVVRCTLSECTQTTCWGIQRKFTGLVNVSNISAWPRLLHLQILLPDGCHRGV